MISSTPIHLVPNRLKYPDNLEEIVTKAVEHAKKARELTGCTDALIAA